MPILPHQTSANLLEGLQRQDPVLWERFVILYTPLLLCWCQRHGLLNKDAPDVLQEVFHAVAKNRPELHCEGGEKSFHHWLWKLTRKSIFEYSCRRSEESALLDERTLHEPPQQLGESRNELPDEEEMNEDCCRLALRALELMKPQFEEQIWKAFWSMAADNRSVGAVAEELQMSIGAVYNARYQVMQRLRQELDGLF